MGRVWFEVLFQFCKSELDLPQLRTLTFGVGAFHDCLRIVFESGIIMESGNFLDLPMLYSIKFGRNALSGDMSEIIVILVKGQSQTKSSHCRSAHIDSSGL